MGKLKKSFNYILQFLRNPLYIYFFWKGILPFRWKELSSFFVSDLINYKKASLKEKTWAYRRGFTAEIVHRYGIDVNNYTDYISEFEFYKTSSYKNRRLSRWYDDKLTTWYILNPFKGFLPIHYYAILSGKIRQIYGYSDGFKNNFDGIIDLLHKNKELIVKRTWGTRGVGVWKISYVDNNYFINSKRRTSDELLSHLTNNGDLIITEYIHAHPKIKKFYAKSPNSMRIITTFDQEEGAKITATFIKIGTEKTGIADNFAQGGVMAAINQRDGSLYRPVVKKDKQIIPCLVHPDTGQKIEGIIPNWSLIVTKITEISNYLCNTPYLGYDVVVTDNGFKILEINSHGTTYVQIWFPFYKNEYQKKLFRQ